MVREHRERSAFKRIPEVPLSGIHLLEKGGQGLSDLVNCLMKASTYGYVRSIEDGVHLTERMSEV